MSFLPSCIVYFVVFNVCICISFASVSTYSVSSGGRCLIFDATHRVSHGSHQQQSGLLQRGFFAKLPAGQIRQLNCTQSFRHQLGLKFSCRLHTCFCCHQGVDHGVEGSLPQKICRRGQSVF